MKSNFIVLAIFVSFNCFGQKTIKLDSIIYFFVKESILIKRSSELYVIKDSVVFNKENKIQKTINSTLELAKRKRNKTCLLNFTKMQKLSVDDHSYLELHYNVQRYIGKNKGKQIWRDEGLYIFKVQLDDSMNSPIKIQYVNGLAPIDLTPVN